MIFYLEVLLLLCYISLKMEKRGLPVIFWHFANVRSSNVTRRRDWSSSLLNHFGNSIHISMLLNVLRAWPQNARYCWALVERVTYQYAHDLGATLWEMAAFEKATEDCRDLSLSQVLTNLFKILSCRSLYRFRKYSKSWLVVQNLRIALIKMFISSKLLLDKCQTKSFEDMNILIKAILKFCTTNQLFEYLFSEKPL